MRGIFIHIASQERIKEIDLMGIKIMVRDNNRAEK